MILDSENHRDILVDLVQKAHFPGYMSMEVVKLLGALEAALVVENGDHLNDRSDASNSPGE